MPEQNAMRVDTGYDSASAIWSLSRLASLRADDVPVAWYDGRLRNWDDFRRDTRALMAQIDRRGRGRWLLVSDNAYALAVGFLAAIHAGCSVVLPANLQREHLAGLAGDLDGVAAHLSDGDVPPGSMPLLPAVSAVDSRPFRPVDPDETAIVLHTSGTTGAPLSIRRTLRSLEIEVATLDAVFGSDVDGCVVGTVPPHHIYGLLFRILWPLSAGRPFMDTVVRYPEQLAAVAAARSRVALVSSPAFLKRALPVTAFEELGGSLSAIFSSGGALPDDVHAAYAGRLAAPVIDIYGSTETGGVAYRRSRDARLPEAWQVLPGVETALETETGRLQVRSPHAAIDGWFRTGDTAVIRPDGRLDLGGRADRIVKIEEHRVSLDEVERYLGACPEVESVRVIAGPAKVGGRTAVAAAIVPSAVGWDMLAEAGKNALKQRLRNALTPHLDDMAVPRRWRFVRSIHQADSGKISAMAVAALFEPALGREVAPEILERTPTANSLSIRMRLQPRLFWFRGHFDEMPVLAGVVQLGWALQFGQEAFGIDAPVLRIEALKFFRILPAGTTVTLDLRFDADRRRIHFEYSNDGIRHSAGRLVFAEAP